MKPFLTYFILYYLRFLARVALFIHKPYTIGIAGSVGKSSARNALYAVLKDEFRTKLVSGNSETGVPLGILGIIPIGYSASSWGKMLILAPFKIFSTVAYSHMIVEMGIDDPFPPKNMQYLLTIIKPEIAIILNAAATHTMQFEKTLSEKEKALPDKKRLEVLIDRIAEEDSRIVSSDCLVAIYNGSDPGVSKHILNLNSKAKLLSFSDNVSSCIFKNYKIGLSGSGFDFLLKTKDKEEKISLFFKDYLLPEKYKDVFSPVIITCNILGIPAKRIEEALSEKLTLPKGRCTIFKGIKNTTIIDSSYNASKSSVLTFLEMLKELKKQTKRNIIFLFGEMRELGDESRVEHEQVADTMIGIVDKLYCVGDLTKQFVLPKIDKKIPTIYFSKSTDAGKHLAEGALKDSIILVKGSQNTIFLEEAIKPLLKNSLDEKMLCRQEPYWIKIKKQYLKR